MRYRPCIVKRLSSLVRIQLARRDMCQRRKATPAETFVLASPRLALRVDSAAVLLRLFHALTHSSSPRPSLLCHFAVLPSVPFRSHRLKRPPGLIDHFCRRKKWRDSTSTLLYFTPHRTAISLDIESADSEWFKNLKIRWKINCTFFASQADR